MAAHDHTGTAQPTKFAAFGRLLRSKVALGGAVALVVLALAGTSLGYSALSKTVTLSVDGEPREVTAIGDTVGDVLDSEGLDVSERDIVAPDLDEPIDEGERISVRFARELELVVDGETTTHWVTSNEVSSALGEIGKPFKAARLSTSRGAEIERGGLELEVVTPKKLVLAIEGKKPVKRKLKVLTVEEALEELDIEPDKNDKAKPGLQRTLEDGDRIVFTKIGVRKQHVDGETVEHGTIERKDDSMFEGEEEVVREGEDGVRDVTYRVHFRNGEVVNRTVLSQKVLREPVPEIVRVGTKEGDTMPTGVWAALAQCESGGNPQAVNPAGPYYGLYQFTASTWASVGGTGLPTDHGAAEQTKRAQILQARSGWGQWPACAASLGLL